ncbi:hypothetical protein SDC9_101780 [bioreactor metagenome]|uniref:Uncharacterized protein n=1 Tax=bioreactor metagenome TaxID=1076179 RepID=A0A645AP25_9ZZZZ
MAKNANLITLNGSRIDDAALLDDFCAADKIGPFWIGKTAFYYRDGLKKRCIPFTDIDQAFMRIEPVPTRCCCCKLDFEIYRLVVCSQGKELADIRTEDEGMVDKALAFLKNHSPKIKLGYTKPA